MKKCVLLLGFALAANCLLAQSELFFSEYIEGSSNNKALEIFNPTSIPVDLAASNYVVQIFANGANTATYTIPLAGILDPGKTFVITHTQFSLTPGVTHQQMSGSVNFNGDDAVVLKKGGANGEITDVIGQVGTDPGTEWKSGTVTTLNMTLTRKSTITAGDVVATDPFDVAVEWNASSTDDVTDLGKHVAVVSNPMFSLNPESLSFITSAVGVPSVSKRFILINNDTIGNLSITAGPDFEISKDSLSGFGQTYVDTAKTGNSEDIRLFVRYNPSSGFSHLGKVVIDTILPQKISLAVRVSGQVIGNTLVPISSIQSNSKSTPFKGVRVIVQGVVTKDLQKATEQKGFYIQDLSPDTSDLTSEGIFIFDSLGSVNVAVGNVVKVSGIADELFNQTVVKNVSSVTILELQHALPIPTSITFPLDSVGVLEKYEGMLVQFGQRLTVTEVYNLGRYGEVLLAVNGPLFTPTNFIDPNDEPASGITDSGASNVPAIRKQIDLQNRSKILLSDDLSIQNPNPVPFIDPLTGTFRVGSTLDTLTAILAYDFNVYRLYTVNKPKINYDPRPSVPEVGAANLKIAAMNVLNFFNGDGNGGGFPTARGATTAFELRRQKAKIVAAVKGLDADILGMMEMENDGDGAQSALKELVDSVNVGQTALNKYAFVMESNAKGNPGTDVIKVAIMYKTSHVTPVGVGAFNNSSSFTSLGRPPLAQTFSLNSNAEKLTVVVNHFKSKSCSGATGLDADQLDGQSCWNDIRKKQAAELLTFISTLISSSNDSDVVIMGDFNAYNEEDPLDKLRKGSMQTLLENSYSFVFDGQLGALDHAFATNSLAKQLTGIDKWHINSPEPIIIDYTTAFKTQDLYVPNQYRASDHDPLLIGFSLGKPITSGLTDMEVPINPVFPNPVKRGSVLHFNAESDASLRNAQGVEVAKSLTLGALNTSGLHPGLYMLHINGKKITKVIVTE